MTRTPAGFVRQSANSLVAAPAADGAGVVLPAAEAGEGAPPVGPLEWQPTTARTARQRPTAATGAWGIRVIVILSGPGWGGGRRGPPSPRVDPQEVHRDGHGAGQRVVGRHDDRLPDRPGRGPGGDRDGH